MNKFRMFLTVRVLAVCLALAVAAIMTTAGNAPAQSGQDTVRVQVVTSMGSFILELYPDKAPATVANFLEYAGSGYYEGTVFHRVMAGFVIQGGGMDKDLNPKRALAPIVNEADNGLKNEAYTVAMARTPDPHSATSQFYINLTWNRSLDHVSKTAEGWGYCVFGRVYTGKQTVDAIAGVKVRQVNPYMTHVPVEPVVIERVTVLP